MVAVPTTFLSEVPFDALGAAYFCGIKSEEMEFDPRVEGKGSLPHNVQKGSGAHSVFSPMDISSRDKVAGERS
jgi:hypothetical protein